MYHFTEPAKLVLADARRVAQRFATPELDVDHILIGICQNPDCYGARLLAATNVRPKELREALEAGLRPGARSGPAIPFTTVAKQVLERAMEVSSNLKHDHLGTEHLLLGALVPGRSVHLDAVVAALGIQSEAIRGVVERNGNLDEGTGPIDLGGSP